MNNYEDWAHLVARKLKGEADVIAAIDKEELDDASATEVFVNTVLKPFIPENYGIGAGRIVDAFGHRSAFMDVVIYNRSFPRIGLQSTQSDYLYESVLAAFVVRAKYLRKTFFESMDACASMANLATNVDKTVLVQLARKNGLKPGPNKTFIHEDPLRTARFELIGSPPAFMFGFTGFKNSYRQLQENIELWIEQRTADNGELPMRALPAVIATQGCFAWRNAAPLALSNREMLGVGNDAAPIRLIVLQLLYLLNRRLNVTTDGYGLKPNLSAYLSQFAAPKFELGIGDVDTLVRLRIADDQREEVQQSKRLQPARDHSQLTTDQAPQRQADKPAANPVQQTAAASSAAIADEPEPDIPDFVASAPAEAGMSSGVFDKPSPFASIPRPTAEAAKPAAREIPKPYRVPSSPLGSAPIPGISRTAEQRSMPTAPLGSAPIPDLIDAPEEAEPMARPRVAPLGSAPIPSIRPPIPAVDIELTGDLEILDDDTADAKAADDTSSDTSLLFESTMVITPDASLSRKPTMNSTEAFIDRVKEQLAAAEKSPADDEDAFIQTTRL